MKINQGGGDMTKARTSLFRGPFFAALLVLTTSLATGIHPAGADVTAVRGNAFGYSVPSLTIFGGAQTPVAPTPNVTLTSDASNSPQNASAPTGSIRFGPAQLLSSGPIAVSTQGSLGAGGSVTSSADIQNLNTSGQEVFTASRLQSTCNASEGGVSGSTTVTGGRLQTSEGDPNVDGDEAFVDIPANPPANHTVHGTLESVGDSFDFVFNEQVTNSDGSITITALHQKLLGPTAVGDVFLGQVTCGVTATAATTTTTSTTVTTSSTTTTTAPGSTTTTSTTTTLPGSTTTTAPGSTTTTTSPGSTTTTTTAPGATTTTTTAPGATTTTAPSTTTTTTASATTTTAAPSSSTTTTAPAPPTVSEVGGGAYGFYVTVSLFGGAPASRGPTPSVTLPPGGSSTPVTASEPSGEAKFGPAILFSSDRLEVSTQGTTGADGSVTSSANITNQNRSGQEQFTAASIASTCSASPSGSSGSTTISGGKLITSEGNPDVEGDETVVDLPANPAPNTMYEAKLETVGDSFTVTLNEQQATGGGITVNAMHMRLIGPTAVGELIVGQARCSLTSSGSGVAGGSAAGSAGSGLATTGEEARLIAVLALLLVAAGWNATCFARWRGPLKALRSAVPRRSGVSPAGHSTGALGGWRHRMRRWMSTSPS
jgi:hypothetical protein